MRIDQHTKIPVRNIKRMLGIEMISSSLKYPNWSTAKDFQVGLKSRVTVGYIWIGGLRQLCREYKSNLTSQIIHFTSRVWIECFCHRFI